MFARTARLLLRPAWAEDAAAITRALDEPAFARNVAGVPSPYKPTDAAAFLAIPNLPSFPRLLMIERNPAGAEVVGCTAITPDAEGGPLLDYWVRRDRWGRGYATEAGHAVLDIAAMLRLPRLRATCFLDNPAAGAVLAKLGFLAVGTPFPHESVGRSGPALAQGHVHAGIALRSIPLLAA